MIVDFQHHYTPRELVERRLGASGKALNYADGVPSYIFHRLLYDLDEHVRMMDLAGIDVAVLSSGAGMDGELETCRFVNDSLAEAARAYPGRFIGLAHVPPLGGAEALRELARCARELGFPGVVITSEAGGAPLDAAELDPFWAEVCRLGVYVFVHPSLRPPGVEHMQAFDLARSVGREFALVMATLRLINGRVLDRFPELRVQMAHLGGGLPMLLGRVRSYQDKEFWGTAGDPRHGALPERELDHYLRERMVFDTAGFCGEPKAVQAALLELPPSAIVLGTDYPQEIRSAEAVRAFVGAIRALGEPGAAILEGNVGRLLAPSHQVPTDG